MAESAMIPGEPERWLPVPGWEGLYEVSNLGSVRALPRQTAAGRRGGRVLRPTLEVSGYLRVQLYRDGKLTLKRIHTLVAAAFLGPRPAGMEVCHGRGGPRDNSLVNLRYGTSQENSDDMVREGAQSRGEHRPTAKLTEILVREIRERYASGGSSQATLAREFGVSKDAISSIILGRTWRHVSGPRGSLRSPSERSGKLVAAQVTVIRRRYAAGESQHVLAREYAIAARTIRDLIGGKTWRHVA